MCVYGACFYVCCSKSVGVYEDVCCVAGVVGIIILALECSSMLYVCVGDVMDVVFCLNCKAWS